MKHPPLTDEERQRRSEAGRRRSESMQLIQMYGCSSCCGQFDPQDSGQAIRCPLRIYTLHPSEARRVAECEIPALYASVASGLLREVTAAQVQARVPRPQTEPDLTSTLGQGSSPAGPGWQKLSLVSRDPKEAERLVLEWPAAHLRGETTQRLRGWHMQEFWLRSPLRGYPLELLVREARRMTKNVENQYLADPGLAQALLDLIEAPAEELEARLTLDGLAQCQN